MNLYILSGRFAQIVGLSVAVWFGAMFVGTWIDLSPITDVSRSFLAAGGSALGMLMVAAMGLTIFLVATFLFEYFRRRRAERRQ